MQPAQKIVNDLEACKVVKQETLIKTVGAIGTPERLSADDKFFRKATVMGYKARRTVNVGKVWLGTESADGEQAYPIESSEIHEIRAPEGARYNFKDFYLDVETAGDGLVIFYV